MHNITGKINGKTTTTSNESGGWDPETTEIDRDTPSTNPFKPDSGCTTPVRRHQTDLSNRSLGHATTPSCIPGVTDVTGGANLERGGTPTCLEPRHTSVETEFTHCDGQSYSFPLPTTCGQSSMSDELEELRFHDTRAGLVFDRHQGFLPSTSSKNSERRSAAISTPFHMDNGTTTVRRPSTTTEEYLPTHLCTHRVDLLPLRTWQNGAEDRPIHDPHTCQKRSGSNPAPAADGSESLPLAQRTSGGTASPREDRRSYVHPGGSSAKDQIPLGCPESKERWTQHSSTMWPDEDTRSTFDEQAQGRQHDKDLSWSRSVGHTDCARSTPIRANQRSRYASKRDIFRLAIAGGKIKTVNRPEGVQWNLPLHVKDVPRLVWKLADALIPPEDQDKWIYAKRCLTDSEFLSTIVPPPCLDDCLPAEITEGDLQILLRYQYVRPIAKHHVRQLVRVFTVVEKNDTRRRMICVPDLLNSILLEPGEVNLPLFEELCEDLSQPYVKTGDFAAYYTSFGLNLEVQPFYCFWVPGSEGQRWFAMTSICTGQRQCPLLAQTLSRAICKAAIGQKAVYFKAYIDNIRFAGNSVLVNETWDEFHRICQRLHLQFEDLTDCMPYDFLGIRFNHEDVTTQSAQKSIEKLQSKLQKLERTNFRRATARQLMALLGSLVWISRAALVCVHQYYPCMKFLRRLAASADDLDKEVEVWPCAVPYFRTWITEACYNTPRRHFQQFSNEFETFLFTDASLSGWGAVAIRIWPKLEIFISFGPWSAEKMTSETSHINVLESSSTLIAIRLLPNGRLTVLGGQSEILHLFIDNTTWTGAILKMFPLNWELNYASLQLVLAVAEKDYAAYTVNWIASLSNLADMFTRLAISKRFQTAISLELGSQDDAWSLAVSWLQKLKGELEVFSL